MALERRAELAVASRLDAAPARVWERVITPEGINDELMPLMRMTIPRGVESLELDSVELGKTIGRSWILLFGFLPVEYDEIKLDELDPGRRFLERSRMLTQRYWQHERTLEAVAAGGCVLTDKISWEPRPPVPGKALRPLFRMVFRHRHRRLRARFGGESVAPATD